MKTFVGTADQKTDVIRAKTLRAARKQACSLLSIEDNRELEMYEVDDQGKPTGAGFYIALYEGRDRAWDRRGNTISALSD